MLALHMTLLLLIRACQCLSEWTAGDSQLPRADCCFAIGYDAVNDTILIFGGDVNQRQFVTFKDNIFTDISQTYLTEAQQTYAYAQHYTQMGDNLWMIRDDGEGFVVVNTRTYEAMVPPIDITKTVTNAGCLTSTSGFLIVSGGVHVSFGISMKDVQIYDIVNNEWLLNVSSLTIERANAACVTVNDAVFVIGGYSLDLDRLDSIETLDLSNLPITTGISWNILSGTLRTARMGARAVTYGDDIYVIGGYESYGSTRATSSEVNIINTLTGDCVAMNFDLSLSFAVGQAPSIIVHNVLYSFGGYDEDSINKYQYTILSHPSLSPSDNPSASPSGTPMHNPTNNPFALTTKILLPTQLTTEKQSDKSTLPSYQPLEDAEVQETTGDTVAYETTRIRNNNAIFTQEVIVVVLSSVIVLILVACIVFAVRKRKAIVVSVVTKMTEVPQPGHNDLYDVNNNDNIEIMEESEAIDEDDDEGMKETCEGPKVEMTENETTTRGNDDFIIKGDDETMGE